MFNFRSTTILFFLLLFTMNILGLSGIYVHFYWYIVLVLVYLSISVTMSFFIRSGYHMKALCKAETNEKIIALTFDDGPDPDLTPRLLDVLKESATPATFFCIGKKIRLHADLLRRMVAEGHLIGTHSYSHSDWFDFFSPSRMRKEFRMTVQEVLDATGRKPILFRPPYGVINPMVRRALHKSGFHVIGFSNRAWDTSSRKDEIIFERLKKNLSPGDIILLHDTVPASIEVVKKLVEYTHQAGYRIVPLDRLLNIQAYED
jgi:peptidoglycan/xylan/chitin deacetylase (PgdA/CDA1 family)